MKRVFESSVYRGRRSEKKIVFRSERSLCVLIKNSGHYQDSARFPMVRPKASAVACEFAMKFAFSVTIETENKNAMIPRVGGYSVYAAFSHLATAVRKNEIILFDLTPLTDLHSGLSIRLSKKWDINDRIQ